MTSKRLRKALDAWADAYGEPRFSQKEALELWLAWNADLNPVPPLRDAVIEAAKVLALTRSWGQVEEPLMALRVAVEALQAAEGETP